MLTDAERRQAAIETLDASIAVYDETIQREQGYIHDRAKQKAEDEAENAKVSGPLFDDPSLGDGEVGVSEAPPPNGNDGESSTTGNNGEGSQTADGKEDGEASGKQRKGDYANSGSSAPQGLPDGSDDDVVARQIREAAEKETDPELRKKLWEEYRKYKQSQ